MPATAEFKKTFEDLKAILKRHERRLNVIKDAPGEYIVHAGYSEKYKKEIWIGGVRMGKAYVSYHFMPVYMYPDLVRGLSPDLKRRMQGKSCFNLKKPDLALLKELAALTKTGLDRLDATRSDWF